jgi:SAM-dependent methyltransferase
MAEWWAGEIAGDAAYRRDVDPLLDSLLPERADGIVLDLGCGEGRLADRADVGIDRSVDLLSLAARRMPVVAGDLAALPFGAGAIAGAFAVLVLEHLPDAGTFFAEAARVVAAGGWLVLVLNHPLWTAPGSGPFVDPTDGEVLWRWGDYLDRGHSDEPIAAGGALRFHHRPIGDLLSTAAHSGWALAEVAERPVGHGSDPILAAQTQIPRLLGVRWRRGDPSGMTEPTPGSGV